MIKIPLVTGVAAVGLVALPANAATLWDNGGPNGNSGYSNATAGVFGFRRTLLDDFLIASDGTRVQELHWKSVWGTPMGGAMGVGAEMSIRSDAAGTPGNVILVANLTGYSEVFTGNILFSREEVMHWATFSDIALDAGKYWFEATVVGPENNFWLTADVLLDECWVNYQDLGGFSSGTAQFGVAQDVNWSLHGVPAPGALGVLALAVLARTRRCRD